MFVHSKAHRSCYMNCLMQHGLDQQSSPSLKFIPLPAATRWDTWFRMAFYVHNYLGYMQEFYNDELQIELSETIKKIVDVFNNPDENRRSVTFVGGIWPLTRIGYWSEFFDE
ncbi:17350_t:CDS:2, partial [Cetraspora pellucida]